MHETTQADGGWRDVAAGATLAWLAVGTPKLGSVRGAVWIVTRFCCVAAEGAYDPMPEEATGAIVAMVTAPVALERLVDSSASQSGVIWWQHAEQCAARWFGNSAVGAEKADAIAELTPGGIWEVPLTPEACWRRVVRGRVVAVLMPLAAGWRRS